MADRDIIQRSISQLGQSQTERAAKELEPGFVDVDERSAEDLLDFTQRFADLVRHYRYDAATTSVQASAGWRRYFEHGAATPEELLAATDGATPAQLALFLAFLRLYELPRATLNRLTSQHLRFQYDRVLGFVPRPAVADHAHVVFELKKHTQPVRLLTTHVLSAPKDATGVERIYRPVREAVVNNAKIDHLRTILVDSAGRGTIRIAPVADSSDGVGGELPPEDPEFAPFGHLGLPAGRVGFAIASPTLRMAEGTRAVKLELELASTLASGVERALGAALEAFATGEQGWIGPYTVSVGRSGGWLSLSFTVPASEKAVIDHDPAVHGSAIAAAGPVAQIQLKPGSPGVGFDDLGGLTLQRARVSVSVAGVSSVVVENDAGRLDPKKPFHPFGTQPIAGSRFMVGADEILSKALTALELNIQWHGVPSDFAAHYADYGVSVTAARFTVDVAYTHGSGRAVTHTGVRLFENGGTSITLDLGPKRFVPPARRDSPSDKLRALRTSGSVHASEKAKSIARASQVLAEGNKLPIESERSLVTLALVADFLHATYRKVTLENAIGQKRRADGSPIVLNEPYTPAIRSITIDYAARTAAVDVRSTELDDFTNPAVQFFHVDAFGARREHGWLRDQLGHVADKAIPLIPPHPDEGELLIGISGIAARDSTNVLFQVAEGSADPDVDPPEILWFALCDNHWKRLDSDELVLDTTNRLLKSGLVGVVIPPETTTENTLLESGLVWLKAAVMRDTAATSRLLAVLANAAEVKFEDRGNDPRHLEVPLGAGSIGKMRTPIAAIKSVTQPYASFGGRMTEASQEMTTRASERLRHKNRCITPWDYERIVLEAFPRIHKVKCLPHARADGHWLSPGHLLLVVVPDLRNDNARDPLQPRADAETLRSIKAHVEARAGMQVTIAVKNPTYQKVRLDFHVKFYAGYEGNAYANELRTELTAFLSPWAFDADVPISFGGVLYRSVLLNFVEERSYVDYVTDFKLFTYTDTDATFGPDLAEVTPRTPDAILVSDTSHDVRVLA